MQENSVVLLKNLLEILFILTKIILFMDLLSQKMR